MKLKMIYQLSMIIIRIRSRMKMVLIIVTLVNLSFSCSNEVDFTNSDKDCKFFMNYSDTECSTFLLSYCTFTECVSYSSGKNRQCLSYHDYNSTKWDICTNHCCDPNIVYDQNTDSINQCQEYITQVYKIGVAVIVGIVGGIVALITFIIVCGLCCKGKCPDRCYGKCCKCCNKKENLESNQEIQNNLPEILNSNEKLQEPDQDDINNKKKNKRNRKKKHKKNHNEDKVKDNGSQIQNPQTSFEMQPKEDKNQLNQLNHQKY